MKKKKLSVNDKFLREIEKRIRKEKNIIENKKKEK